jgi:RNA recognition motif-containing protein
MCGETENKATRFAFVEFSTRESALMAMGLTNIVLGNAPIKVMPSKTAIQAGSRGGGGPPPRGPPPHAHAAAYDPTYQERASRTLYVGGVDSNVPPPALSITLLIL